MRECGCNAGKSENLGGVVLHLEILLNSWFGSMMLNSL